MDKYLQFIPTAATSPYAFGAYAICAALFFLVGAKLKTVRSVLKVIDHVPDKDRRHTIESITNSVIPDNITAEEWIRNNRNRAIFQLAAVALLLTAAIAIIDVMGAGSIIRPPPPESEALVEAHSFLARLDGGDYKGAYDSMADVFRQNFPLQEWLAASDTYRAPLGQAAARSIADSNAAQQPYGGRQYNTHSYTFTTKFANRDQPVLELVTLSSPGLPTPWKVAAYHVGVDPNSTPKIPTP